MNADIQSARDDLAYMRALVGDPGRMQVGAELFIWGGLLYGLQCIGHFLNIVGAMPLSTLGLIALGFGPTVIFLVALCVIIWRTRKIQSKSVASRATNAVFQGAGIANLVLAFVFAFGAITQHNGMIWLYHPIVVCMFQGVAWFVAWVVSRRAWFGLIALGWIATTAACGVLVSNVALYLLVIGVALILLMAIPGYVLSRSSKISG
ncbi:MAG: hypothetical protein ABUS57_03725 [Pseudomonadota bacterium]